MARKYQFTCNKDPIEMVIGDAFTISANDRRQAYRLAARKMGFKVKLVREVVKDSIDKNQMLLFKDA